MSVQGDLGPTMPSRGAVVDLARRLGALAQGAADYAGAGRIDTAQALLNQARALLDHSLLDHLS